MSNNRDMWCILTKEMKGKKEPKKQDIKNGIV